MTAAIYIRSVFSLICELYLGFKCVDIMSSLSM